jgi:hypothetical protein
VFIDVPGGQGVRRFSSGAEKRREGKDRKGKGRKGKGEGKEAKGRKGKGRKRREGSEEKEAKRKEKEKGIINNKGRERERERERERRVRQMGRKTHLIEVMRLLAEFPLWKLADWNTADASVFHTLAEQRQ